MPVSCECSLCWNPGITDDDMNWMGIMAPLRRYGVGSGQYTILLGALVFDDEILRSSMRQL